MRAVAARVALMAAVVLPGAPALAGEWVISPSVGLYESFTDNAQLDPPGQGNWDFFTNLVPAVTIHGEGGRMSLDLAASLNGILYARDGSLDDVNLDLSEASRTELIPELLFLDTRAVVTQLATGPGDAVSGSQNSSQQGSTIATLLISPYLRNHFGDFADSELRYTYGQVLSPSGDVGNEFSNDLSAVLSSGTRFSRLRWTLTGNADFTIQGGSSGDGGGSARDTYRLLAKADVEYAISRQWALLGGLGYERIHDETLDEEPNGIIGDAGFRWRPGPRLTLVLLFNHRFDSNFPSGELSYQIGPSTLLTASYSEGIETGQGLLTEDVGFLTTDESGNFIDARTAQLFSLETGGLGIDNSAFRQRLFTVDLTSTIGRNDLSANAYYVRREGGQEGNETGLGGSLGWRRELSELDRIGATVRYEYVSHNQTDNLVNLGLSYSHRLSETLEAVVLYSFTNQFSTSEDDRFRENVVTVGLVKTFQ
ncbi:MAG: TIGR03016 family PEP-CTERM system-associated outer membrane protein [Dongiaceae bacterium]